MDIVIGYDTHRASHCALCFGANLARALGGHIHVIHVEDIDDQPIDPDSPDFEQQVTDRLDEQRHQVESVLGAHSEDWDYSFGHGNVADAILDASRRHAAALIVVGQPHHGFAALIEHSMSGSGSRGLLKNTHYPVVVVPEQADLTGILR